MRLPSPRWVAIAVTIGVALGAFTLSFASLADLAAAHGVPSHLAWIFPLIVDGTTIAGTVSTVSLARNRFAWLTLVGAALVSVAGNALHGAAFGPVGIAIAVVPPIALLALTQLTVKHTRETAPPARPPYLNLREALTEADLAQAWRDHHAPADLQSTVDFDPEPEEVHA
ncbi:membrane protein [Gordonia phage Aleemily]|uniref:Membrane protein n=1 Tax=Gordonia phage Aleemily TaxID=2965181 RepID=A0A9E7TYE8_9CAUD|nr:membrane protein [Gordonia phage Aleemily]